MLFTFFKHTLFLIFASFFTLMITLWVDNSFRSYASLSIICCLLYIRHLFNIHGRIFLSCVVIHAILVFWYDHSFELWDFEHFLFITIVTQCFLVNVTLGPFDRKLLYFVRLFLIMWRWPYYDVLYVWHFTWE